MLACRCGRDSLVKGRFFFQAEDGIRDDLVTGVQTCALPISCEGRLWITDSRVTHSHGINSKEQGAVEWMKFSVEIKIGRASCRERVQISAAAEAVKRKNTRAYEKTVNTYDTNAIEIRHPALV